MTRQWMGIPIGGDYPLDEAELTVEEIDQVDLAYGHSISVKLVCAAARAWVEQERAFWEAAKTAPLPGERLRNNDSDCATNETITQLRSESIHSRAAEEYEELIKSGAVDADSKLAECLASLREANSTMVETAKLNADLRAEVELWKSRCDARWGHNRHAVEEDLQAANAALRAEVDRAADALAQCRDTCALLEEENAIPSVREYNDLRARVAELEKIHDGRKEVGRAVAAERERCARIVQDWRQEPNEDREVLLPEIAAAIRAP